MSAVGLKPSLVLQAQSTCDSVSCSAGVCQRGDFPVPLSNPLSPQIFNAVQFSCCCLSSWQLRQQQHMAEPLSTSVWGLSLEFCEGQGLPRCQ